MWSYIASWKKVWTKKKQPWNEGIHKALAGKVFSIFQQLLTDTLAKI